MSTTANASTNWNDNEVCPFCGTTLADPGAGFIDHLDDVADCEERFETWRSQVADDVTGGWSG